MTTAQNDRPSPELKQAIQDGIARRARGRIQALEVEAIGNRIIIRGCVPSYYLKQLVLQGVLDAVGRAGAGGVEFNVRVEKDLRSSSTEWI